MSNRIRTDLRTSIAQVTGVVVALIGLLGTTIALFEGQLLAAIFASVNIGLGLSLMFFCSALKQLDRKVGKLGLDVRGAGGEELARTEPRKKPRRR